MTVSAIDTSGWDSFFQLLGILLVFVFVLVITYVCTRWIAKYQKGIHTNKNIRVIETFRITNNKYIQIIEVGEVYLVIAVCKDTVTLLCQMDKEKLNWLPEDELSTSSGNENFQEVLKKLRERLPRK